MGANAVLHKRISEEGSFIGNLNCFEKLPILPHGLKGIFISKDAKIGKECVIFHQVTIGSNTAADSKGVGAPVIGDYCYIGAGAKIIGNVHVGNNCRIGANAVVTKDVPANSTVYIGNICVRERCNAPDNRFIIVNRNERIVIDEDNKKLIFPT